MSKKTSKLIAHDDREKAAELRRQVAIDHLNNAADELDRACSDLSTVMGASSSYRAIRSLAVEAREQRRILDGHGRFPSDEKLVLDHDPIEAELIAGHGKRHGCGGKGIS